MQNKPLPQEHIEENIKFLLENAPFMLDAEDKLVRELGLFYLPYSTGIEIECYMDDEVVGENGCRSISSIKEEFKTIPNIMYVDVNSYGEQRFRIPNGIEGLQCLFLIAEKMKLYGLFNPKSGLHYHIDCTDHFEELYNGLFLSHKDYILKELDKWDYKGTYNTRTISIGGGGIWVRLQSHFKTMEIRIGEMTFDYNLLFKRITHCNDIVRTVKPDQIAMITRYGTDSKEIINNRKIILE